MLKTPFLHGLAFDTGAPRPCKVQDDSKPAGWIYVKGAQPRLACPFPGGSTLWPHTLEPPEVPREVPAAYIDRLVPYDPFLSALPRHSCRRRDRQRPDRSCVASLLRGGRIPC